MPAQQRLFTLTLDQHPVNLRITGFSAREALNEPFSIAVDLLGEQLAPALETLLQCPAFLAFGPAGEGLHGSVQTVTERHLDAQQYHYHLTFGPRLLSLGRQPRLRAFHDLDVPTILHQLLHEHGLLARDYRFELARGVYPPRPLCIQYGETDLQLFQRLCAEEGIHYHFEHTPQRHVLVLADDGQSFVELAPPLPYQNGPSANPLEPKIHRLNECQSLDVSLESPAISQGEAASRCAVNLADGAANQTPLERELAGQARGDQRGRRQLERMRCRRRQLEGASNQALLRSGRTFEVKAHPQVTYNKHWLLTEITHHADSDHPSTAGPEASYHNDFKAIPQATPFRPALTTGRPAAFGHLLARVAGVQGQAVACDSAGRLEVVLESHHLPNAQPLGLWVPWLGGTTQAPPVAGSRVLLEFIDADLEQPVISGCLAPRDEPPPPGQPDASGTPPPHIELDGQAWNPAESMLNLSTGQVLDVTAGARMTLHSNGNLIQVRADSIVFQGRQQGLSQASPDLQSQAETTSPETECTGEIYLFEHPHDQERCLPELDWYIVRMPRPGLEELKRLEYANILLEGRSDSTGRLRLNREQQRRLAREYALTPGQLNLLYPGRCIELHEYFQQHWSHAQRQAFARCGQALEDRGAGLEPLYRWLQAPLD